MVGGLKQILVTDRESIEAGLVVRSRYVVISIHDPGTKKPKVRKLPGLVEVLHLQLDDAEPSVQMQLPPTIRLMTAADARTVWEFLTRHQKTVPTGDRQALQPR